MVTMSENPQVSPYSESALESIKIWSRSSFLLIVATVSTTYFAGAFAIATLLLALLTVVCALITLVKMAKIRFPGFSIMLTVMIILWALFLGCGAALQLIFSEASSAYSECLQQALTITRQQECAKDMSDGLFQQIMGN